MKTAPKKWKQKVARTVRTIAKKLNKKMSKKSSEVVAKEIWTKGLKPKCRTKAIKKYGKK